MKHAVLHAGSDCDCKTLRVVEAHGERLALPLAFAFQVLDADLALLGGSTFDAVLGLVVRAAVKAAVARIHGWLAFSKMRAHAFQVAACSGARGGTPVSEQQQ